MATILHEQVTAFAKSVDRIMEEHRRAMVCCDVEEAISMLLSLAEIFEHIDSRWREEVARGVSNTEQAALACKLLGEISQGIIVQRDRLLKVIAKLEQEGYRPHGATRLRNAVHIPFEKRRLEVPFSDTDFAALTAGGVPPAGSDLPNDSDDDL